MEALKSKPGASLETCYSRVLCEAADVAKTKPRDQNALAPREMKSRSLEKSSPHQSSNDEVCLEKRKQDNGMTFVPQKMFKKNPEQRRRS